MPRRPGGGPPSPGFSDRSGVAVRSWVSVVISELEVDERRHPAGSQRRDQEEYDRDGHPQRDRAEPRESRLQSFGGPMGKELRHEPGGDREQDGGGDER